jgi:molybdate transport system substrate-binding protein
MPSTLRILSAGAAQAVVEQIISAFKRDTGTQITADFGAVGAMKTRVVANEPVDVIVLSRALIDELVTQRYVSASSVCDLGTVGTGVAVRAGTPLPDVSNAEVLRASILAAKVIACPDPAIATAGKIVVRLMQSLGVADEVKTRLRFFPNGYAAMKWLAQSSGSHEIGITQNTEILPNKGVSYAGPLPDAFQMKTVYSVGIASRSQNDALARDFVTRLTAPEFRSQLTAAGYELA